jgi:hypothetical protein
MIRPFTLLCALAAGASGLYVYQIKHRTLLLDRQITRTVQQDAQMRARIGILQAEWTLLNEPDRLAGLAGQFLALKPLAPTQFVTLADLDRALPPVAPVAPPPEIATQSAPEPATATALAPALAPPPGPERPFTPERPVAAATPHPRLPVPSSAAHAAPARPPAPHPAALAVAPAPRVVAKRQLAAYAPVAVAGTTVSARGHSVAAAPVAVFAPVAAPSAVSLLGGARMALAPPVPVTGEAAR